MESETHSSTVYPGTGIQNLAGPFAHGHSSHNSVHDMGKEKERPRIEIVVDQDRLFLKGTGVDVEPALLSGQVALYLAESTSIKEISLQFRGKAKLPVSPHDSLHLNNSSVIYVVCNHEWSFLEGQKRRSHTLKAGRHFFPFQLQVGGSLPSSFATDAHGGVSVTYKLRAHVIRPGLSHNLQATSPVQIIRSFTPEALEYQQTLEIENTWPEKLMYSIMVPHKAWAAGDQLTALAKFSPLVKGTHILRVKTTLNETVKVSSPQGCHDATRVVATARHEIIDGKAVFMQSTPVSASSHPFNTPPVNSGPQSPGFIPQSSEPSTNSDAGPSVRPSAGLSEPTESDDLEPSRDLTTHISIKIPSATCPSHTLEPVTVLHRIRWSIYIGNLDGHTSELRCSLPIHVLDPHLLDEARVYTSAARRLLLGGPEVPQEEEEETVLPSYTAHVRDRVANMFLSDALAYRVTNRWVSSGISPTQPTHPVPAFPAPALPPTSPHSDVVTPLDVSHLPHAPDLATSAPLEWVNSELLLSLSQNSATPPLRDAHSPPDSSSHSQPESRSTSSRHTSRAASPERPVSRGGNAYPGSTGGPNETYVHGGTHANRNLHGLFQVSMKPGRSAPFWLPSRSNPHSNAGSTASAEQSRAQQGQQPPVRALDRETGAQLLHRAFTEVPDYGVASRGFLGGVPPLSSMQGLPSYEEAEG